MLWFEVDGVPSAITLFRSDRGDLFVPFRDATSGSETYGAGRYLEARSLGDGRTLLDFNYAYNPYCAADGQPTVLSSEPAATTTARPGGSTR